MLHPCHHALTTPDKPALICAETGQVVTYRALDDGSNRVAQLFRALGLQSGDHIALMLENQDRKSTRLNSSHIQKSRMPSSA